jgi:hypothetical protein
MVPFDSQQLATPSDFKYQGYIPVDHTMFQGDNTYDGSPHEENEDVPAISNTPKFFIDEIEDVPETEPDHEFHKPPFEEEPQFITEPVVRTVLEPRPFPVQRPTVRGPVELKHIFHDLPETNVVEEITIDRAPAYPVPTPFRPPVRSAPVSFSAHQPIQLNPGHHPWSPPRVSHGSPIVSTRLGH